jgi:hypothetical protein
VGASKTTAAASAAEAPGYRGRRFKMSHMEDDDKYPLIWSIRYAIRYGRRQRKLLDRVAISIRALIFIAGTTAFVSIVGDNEDLIRWAAFLTGILAIVDALWNPAGKAAQSREIEMNYARLNRDAPQMSTKTLQYQYDDLRTADAPEIEALRPVAYNDTVEELGNSSNEKYELRSWQKFFAMLTGGVGGTLR